MSNLEFIHANWSAPKNVRAVMSLRKGGISKPPYANLNLADHVGDNLFAVAGNRDLLREALMLDLGYQWLDQAHSADVIEIESASAKIKADGLITREPRNACCVLTADCLPVMFANKEGTEVAVAHAGWRGLQAGILKNTIAKMTSDPNDIMAWMGPAIGPCHYEVGIEVKESFRANAATQEELNLVESSFAESDLEGKFYMNLYLLARRQLLAMGVSSVSGGDHCTYCEGNKFYSYRRDGKTGRMASIIFFQEEAF